MIACMLLAWTILPSPVYHRVQRVDNTYGKIFYCVDLAACAIGLCRVFRIESANVTARPSIIEAKAAIVPNGITGTGKGGISSMVNEMSLSMAPAQLPA